MIICHKEVMLQHIANSVEAKIRLKTLHGEAFHIGSNFHKVVLRRKREAHIISKQDTETSVLWILHSRDVEAKIECLQHNNCYCVAVVTVGYCDNKACLK